MSINTKAIDEFRKQLKAELGDISKIDERVLNTSVKVGMASAKKHTPVDTGFMEKMWGTTPTKRTGKKSVEKTLYNAADEYALYVNDGHRIVNKAGETVGLVGGKFILETAEKAVRRKMKQEFEKEVKRIDAKYGK